MKDAPIPCFVARSAPVLVADLDQAIATTNRPSMHPVTQAVALCGMTGASGVENYRFVFAPDGEVVAVTRQLLPKQTSPPNGASRLTVLRSRLEIAEGWDLEGSKEAFKKTIAPLLFDDSGKRLRSVSLEEAFGKALTVAQAFVASGKRLPPQEAARIAERPDIRLRYFFRT
jgi:hypothetical protein